MSHSSPSRNQHHNALRLVACLGLLPLLGGLTGCASSRYTQTSNEQINDRATSEHVSAALNDARQHKYFEDVKVETFKDVVQLSGFVNTPDLKSRAGDIARDNAGGRQVHNNITVKE